MNSRRRVLKATGGIARAVSYEQNCLHPINAWNERAYERFLWQCILGLILLKGAISTFGVTGTGSTSYPTTTDTVGNTSLNDSGNNGEVIWVHITASKSGALASVGLDVQGTGGNNLRLAIYDSSSNLLGQSADVAAVANWNDLAITGVSLVNGSQYKLAFQVSGSGNHQYYYNNTPTVSSWRTAQAYGAFPSTVPAESGTAKGLYNMRMTYAQTIGYTKGTRVQYTDTTGGTVSSFSFLVETYTAGDKGILSFWSDNSGSPGTLLWNSNLAGTDPGGTGTLTISYGDGTAAAAGSWPGAVAGALVNNDDYWFLWQINTTDAMPSYLAGDANTGWYMTSTFGTLPGTNPSGTLTAENWTMYLTYSTSTSKTASDTGSGVEALTSSVTFGISDAGSGADNPTEDLRPLDYATGDEDSIVPNLQISEQGAGTDTPQEEVQIPDSGSGIEATVDTSATLPAADVGLGTEVPTEELQATDVSSGLETLGSQAALNILETGSGADVPSEEIIVLDASISAIDSTDITTAYVIAGTAKDESGNPIAGATILLFRTSDDAFIASTTSGGDGSYSFIVTDATTTYFLRAYLDSYLGSRVFGTTDRTLVGS